MIYLNPSEYEQYGLEQSTPAALVAAASSLIDAHCRRPTLGVTQYVERVRLCPGRNSTRLTYLPLAPSSAGPPPGGNGEGEAPALSPFVAVKARYGVPRRGEGCMADECACEVACAFGLPGSWTALDAALLDVDTQTGELALPQHPLGLGFNEVEVTYIAGFAQVPDAVKFACAQIARNAQATPALNVRASGIERMQMEYFADSLLDQSVRELLAPYVAQKVA